MFRADLCGVERSAFSPALFLLCASRALRRVVAWDRSVFLMAIQLLDFVFVRIGVPIGSRVVSEVADEAEERLDGTKEWMRCGAMPYLFTTNGILLVSEGEVGGGDRIHVIQRDRGGVVELAINVEIDVA